VAPEIMSYDELRVGLPSDNLTILGLAKKLASNARTPRPSLGADDAARTAKERDVLRGLVRYRPVSVKHAWALTNTKNKGVETKSYLLEMSNDLSATGIWLKATTTPDAAPVTIVLSDKGKKAAAARISDLLNRGEQVLAVDLLFFGDAKTEKIGPEEYAHMFSTFGERALGIEVAQLVGISGWLKAWSGTPKIKLESFGFRSQLISLMGCDLVPDAFNQLIIRGGIKTLKYLLYKPVKYEDAPDLFCLDLYKTFDIDRLVPLADHTQVKQYEPAEVEAK
jgi:hypothetical protein